MAEPLSVATGIIGLVELAGSIISTCYQYGCAVKGAPREIQSISNDVSSLAGVLAGVNALVDAHSKRELLPENESKASRADNGQDDQPPPYEDLPHLDLESLRAPIADCHAVLQEIRTALGRASWQEDRKLNKVFKRLVWPLKQHQTEALSRRLEKCKATFRTALTATNVSISVDTLQAVEDIKGALAVDRWERQLEAKRAEMQMLYKWLSPVDPAVSHRGAQKLYVEGTGQWIFEEAEWTEWKSSETGLLWLRGIPGSGKTVLLSKLLEDSFVESQETGSVLLYFYCDFRAKESQKPEVVLGTMLCQLCTQLGETPPEVQAFIRRHSKEGREPGPPTFDELAGVLLELIPNIPQVLVVIDALDECLGRDDLLKVLEIWTAKQGFKALVSGREEPDIHQAFKYCNSIVVKAADADVGSYMSQAIKSSSRLSRLKPELQGHIQRALGDGAHGMFRWVALQIQTLQGLRTDRDIRRALDTLPLDLTETYDRILNRIPTSDRLLAARALKWLSQSATPLFLDELAEAAVVDEGIKCLDPESRLYPEDVLEIIGSLVIYQQDGPIALAHHSVKDYLESKNCLVKHPDYHVGSTWTANTDVACSCLTYLLMDDFATGPCLTPAAYDDRIKQYPLLQYAARYWPLHARKNHDKWGRWQDLALALLHPSRTPNFFAWLQALITQGFFSYRVPQSELVSRSRQQSFRIPPAHLTPLYYAASFGLDGIVDALLRQGVDVDEKGGMFGGTALHAAFFRNHARVIDVLVEHGARTDVRDTNRMTAFDVAPFGEAAFHPRKHPLAHSFDGDVVPSADELFRRAGGSYPMPVSRQMLEELSYGDMYWQLEEREKATEGGKRKLGGH